MSIAHALIVRRRFPLSAWAVAVPMILLTAATHPTLRVRSYVCTVNGSRHLEHYKFGPGHFHMSGGENRCNRDGTTCHTKGARFSASDDESFDFHYNGSTRHYSYSDSSGTRDAGTCRPG